MANSKISQLPSATALTGAEIVPLVQGGTTKQTPSLFFPYVPHGSLLASQNGVLADDSTDNASAITAMATSCASSGKILVFDEPGVVRLTGHIAVASFSMELAPGVILTNMSKTGQSIQLSGTSPGLVMGRGAKIKHYYCQRLTITALSITSNVATATVPGHLFAINDIVQCRNTVGITTSLEGTSKTITGVSGNDVTFAHTSADSSATIPVERADGWNTDAKAIYPTMQLSRTGSYDDANIIVQGSATNALVEGCSTIGGRSVGLFLTGAVRPTVRNLYVKDSASDGFHITQATYGARIGYAEIVSPGDDGFAVIGYRDHKSPNLDISVDELYIHDSLYNGRGVSMTGVHDVRINRLRAENTYHSGIDLFVDTVTYFTLGVRGVWIGEATLHTTGNRVAEFTGWQSGVGASFQISGQANASEVTEDVTIESLRIYNGRGRAINDNNVASGTKRLRIRELHIEGGGDTNITLLSPSDFRIEKLRLADTFGLGISVGGANTTGQTVFDDIEAKNINGGTRLYIASIACVSGTITITTEAVHGLSGSPLLRVTGIGSDYTHGTESTQRTGQLADTAMNGNYGSGNGYTAISYPTTSSIEMTVTGKSDTNTPRYYTPHQIPSPKAYVQTNSTTSNDLFQVNASTPLNSFVIKRLRFTEQFLTMESLIEDNSTGGSRVFDVIDNTGLLLQPVSTHNDANELGATIGANRYLSGPYTGAPAGAVIAGNTLYAVPVFIPMGIRFTKIGINCSTLEAAKNARLGIYQVGSTDLILDAGTVSLASTGDKEITFTSLHLSRGWYYLVMVSDATGTAAVLYHTVDGPQRGLMYGHGLLASNSDPANADFRLAGSFTYGALTSPLTTITFNSATTEPHIWLRR